MTDVAPQPQRRSADRRADDLAVLTGVRSGKRGFYREFRRSSERLEQAVRSMDNISHALVQTVAGPRALLEAVVRAAAEHVPSQWVVLGFARGAMPTVTPRQLLLGADGRLLDTLAADLPPHVVAEAERLRQSGDDGSPYDAGGPAAPGRPAWLRVRAVLDGTTVGGISLLPGDGVVVEEADLPVLRILANQAAVAVHNSALYQDSVRLRTRSERLYEEASQQARDLAQRNADLEQAQHRLILASQRELLDTERHRIARELHDSVTQHVLSAGMLVDVAQSDAAALGPEGVRLAQRLESARTLTAAAVGQLRSAIWALGHTHGDGGPREDLPGLLHQVAEQHAVHLDISVRIEGPPREVGTETEHALARIAGEALFNVAAHAEATRAVVRLAYRADGVRLTVSDDGRGDPAQLRRLLRLESQADSDGRHRGLANMAGRAQELGGRFAVRRSRLGGVRIEVHVGIPADPTADVGVEKEAP